MDPTNEDRDQKCAPPGLPDPPGVFLPQARAERPLRVELALGTAVYIEHFSQFGPPTQLARLSHPNEFEDLHSTTTQQATSS